MHSGQGLTDVDDALAGREGVQRQRDATRLRVLQVLLQRPGLSRNELMEIVGISRATVTALTPELEYAGLVEQTADVREPRPRAAGRPPLSLSLTPGEAFA